MEIDEDDFDDLLAEKRHKELLELLRKIASLLSTPVKSDEFIIDTLKSNIGALNNLVATIRDNPNEVSVSVDNKELFPLLSEIKISNDNVLKILQDKPIVNEFRIVSNDRWTKTVEVIYKKASEIKYKN